jgi:hypothetical protein
MAFENADTKWLNRNAYIRPEELGTTPLPRNAIQLSRIGEDGKIEIVGYTIEGRIEKAVAQFFASTNLFELRVGYEKK